MPRLQSFDIHISDVAAFKGCRRKWVWSSPLRANLSPIKRSAPLFIGSAVHHCLEHYHKWGLDFKASLDAFVNKELLELRKNPAAYAAVEAEISEQLDLVQGLLDHYAVWQRYDQSTMADRNWETIDAEHKFKLPLWRNTRRAVTYAGTYDRVIRHKETGEIYLEEIKTTRSITERIRQIDFDEQTRAYLLAASEVLGLQISGIIYTLIRKKLPKTPEPLKSGERLSKAIKTGEYHNTSAEWYLEAVKKFHGANWRSVLIDYETTIQELLNAGNFFLRRVKITKAPRELKTFREELIDVSRAMIDPRTTIYPTRSYHCNYCAFNAPCLILDRDGPAQALAHIEANFMPNPKYSEAEEE
jgi:hypothetical protein